jgi:hypothetical protein
MKFVLVLTLVFASACSKKEPTSGASNANTESPKPIAAAPTNNASASPPSGGDFDLVAYYQKSHDDMRQPDRG